MFPRVQGHAKIHHALLQESILHNQDDLSERVLRELEERRCNLVYGDSVIVGKYRKRMIYDGQNLIYLGYNNVRLPKEFTVIKSYKTEKNIPLRYYSTYKEINILPDVLENVDYLHVEDNLYQAVITPELSLSLCIEEYEEYKITLFNKYLHSGNTITCRRWGNIYLLDYEDSDMESCNHMVKAAEF